MQNKERALKLRIERLQRQAKQAKNKAPVLSQGVESKFIYSQDTSSQRSGTMNTPSSARVGSGNARFSKVGGQGSGRWVNNKEMTNLCHKLGDLPREQTQFSSSQSRPSSLASGNSTSTLSQLEALNRPSTQQQDWRSSQRENSQVPKRRRLEEEPFNRKQVDSRKRDQQQPNIFSQPRKKPPPRKHGGISANFNLPSQSQSHQYPSQSQPYPSQSQPYPSQSQPTSQYTKFKTPFLPPQQMAPPPVPPQPSTLTQHFPSYMASKIFAHPEEESLNTHIIMGPASAYHSEAAFDQFTQAQAPMPSQQANQEDYHQFFSSSTWTSVLENRPLDVSLEGLVVGGVGLDVHALMDTKLPNVFVMVGKLKHLDRGALAVLVDDRGSVEAELHQGVLEKYKRLEPGCGMWLKGCTVFKPPLKEVALIVTVTNVHQVWGVGGVGDVVSSSAFPGEFTCEEEEEDVSCYPTTVGVVNVGANVNVEEHDEGGASQSFVQGEMNEGSQISDQEEKEDTVNDTVKKRTTGTANIMGGGNTLFNNSPYSPEEELGYPPVNDIQEEEDTQDKYLEEARVGEETMEEEVVQEVVDQEEVDQEEVDQEEVDQEEVDQEEVEEERNTLTNTHHYEEESEEEDMFTTLLRAQKERSTDEYTGEGEKRVGILEARSRGVVSSTSPSQSKNDLSPTSQSPSNEGVFVTSQSQSKDMEDTSYLFTQDEEKSDGQEKEMNDLNKESKELDDNDMAWLSD